jgi:hypothetical protein
LSTPADNVIVTLDDVQKLWVPRLKEAQAFAEAKRVAATEAGDVLRRVAAVRRAVDEASDPVERLRAEADLLEVFDQALAVLTGTDAPEHYAESAERVLREEADFVEELAWMVVNALVFHAEQMRASRDQLDRALKRQRPPIPARQPS